jgi:asparagine synthase (glutamine-hydrolysing)
VDEKAIAEFLEFGFVTDGRSIYKGVAKVPAATILEWSGGTLRAREYWSPPAVSEPARVSFDEAVEATEALFLRAVEKRLQADVPVGALLSGGIDSSLVCWAVARLGGDVKAYTVGTPGDPWDESADARATAATLKIDHQVLEMSATEATGVSELVAAYGEPFACASALGMLAVSRTVAPSATVLLTGDGGDDVFLGYPEHRNFYLAERTARVTPTAAIDWWPAYRRNYPHLLRQGRLRRAVSFFDYVSGGLGAVACARDGFPMYQRHGMVGDRLADVVIDQRSIGWSHESAKRLLADFLEYDRRMRFVGEYLTKVDGATMHHALEARSPFLDQELWEFAASLPFELRLYRGRLKALLRELARRKLGERVASGKKRGFGIPVQRWITGRWRSSVEAAFRDSRLEAEGWIHSGPVLAQLAISAQKQWAPNQLWYVFVLESWLRQERERERLAPRSVAVTLAEANGGRYPRESAGSARSAGNVLPK